MQVLRFHIQQEQYSKFRKLYLSKVTIFQWDKTHNIDVETCFLYLPQAFKVFKMFNSPSGGEELKTVCLFRAG